MSDRTLNPQDSVDLILLLQSYGETLGTLYPRAHVYDNNNDEITGSPFALTHVANNLYSKDNAFQVGDSGTYKVVYIVYTDSGYTTKSSNHGETSDVLSVKIQSTTGLGGYGSMKNRGGDVIVDMDPIFKAIKTLTKDNKALKKLVGKLQKDFDSGLKIESPESDFAPILKELSDLKLKVIESGGGGMTAKEFNEYKSSQKAALEKTIGAIKKNRSMIIKHKFDKGLMKPILQTVADSDLKLVKGLAELKVDISKTIDMKNEEASNKFNESLRSGLNSFVGSLDDLNESIREKLKFTLEGLRSIVYSGKKNKQDINITLKKDEL